MNCHHPDQLFGVWAIETSRFASMVDVCRSADLAALQAAASARASEKPSRPYAVKNGVAMLDVNGPLTKYETSFQALIGGTSMLRTRQAIRAAVRDPDVSSLLLVIDSPGGTVAGTSDLGESVAAAGRLKPTYAFASDLMASAAFWVGARARRIYANSTAQIGSVGVYTVIRDTSGKYSQEGVKVHVLTSGLIKAAGVDGSVVTEEQLDAIQANVDAVAALFVKAIAAGRGVPVARAAEWATGESWIGQQAADVGLVDEIVAGGLDDVVDRIAGIGRSSAVMRVEVESVPQPKVSTPATSGPFDRQILQVAKVHPEFSMSQIMGTVASNWKTTSEKLRAGRTDEAIEQLVIAARAERSPATTTPAITFRKTKDEVMGEISGRVKAGYPKRTLAEGIKLFRQTEAGRKAFDEYDAAPTTKTEAIIVNVKGIEGLRSAAIVEEQLEGPGPDAIWKTVHEEAGLDRVPRSEIFKARQRFLDTPRGIELYKAYAKARNQHTEARERYADALVDEELRPLHDQLALEEDGADHLAESIAPAIAGRRQELAVLAQRGASVAELEVGHAGRLATVKKVSEAALALQARYAGAEFEPEDVPFKTCLAEVLKQSEHEELAKTLIVMPSSSSLPAA